MKRSQASSPTLGSSPQHKKAKTYPSVAQGLVQDAGIDNDDGEWTKVEKRKQKKVKKAEVKLDWIPDQEFTNASRPRFMYSNAEIVKRSHAVGINNIRELVLHIVADAPPPNWLRIDNAGLIQKVVTLLIPGLTPSLLSLPPFPTSATSNPNFPLSIPYPPKSTSTTEPTIPFITSTFSHACPTRAPGDQSRMHSVLSAFFHGPVSNEEQTKRIIQRLASERAHDKDPTQYLLTLDQMVENGYPVPSYMADVFEKSHGWIETPEQPKESLLAAPGENGGHSPMQKIYAIDCEMCLTEDGKELTRVCIIDFYSGLVVYDQLVKPAKPILDYLTRWSGITQAALAPITTTLSQVQTHLLRLLSPPLPNPFTTSPTPPPPPTPILLGHSLESDLKALKLCHPLCIDTALIYHHPRGRPLKPGLAWLTKKWCGREIQTAGEGGHDPEEDARACLELLNKKLDGGPGFGEFKTDMESIFERMGRSTRRIEGAVGSVRSAVVDHGNPAVMHGAKATTAVGCKDDGEVLEGLLDVVPAHQFAFGRFMALADILGWTTPKTTQDSQPTEPAASPSPETLISILSTLDTQLKTLHAALPPRTALIIFTGHSDPRRMAALNQRKSAFETALRNGKKPEDMERETWWTMVDGRELEEEVEKAKRGLLFLGVKL